MRCVYAYKRRLRARLRAVSGQWGCGKELNPGLCAPGHTQDGWVRYRLNQPAQRKVLCMIQKKRGMILLLKKRRSAATLHVVYVNSH